MNRNTITQALTVVLGVMVVSAGVLYGVPGSGYDGAVQEADAVAVTGTAVAIGVAGAAVGGTAVWAHDKYISGENTTVNSMNSS